MSNSSSSSFAPDEPASIIALERVIFNGAGLGAVAYGLNLALFVQCVPLLWAQRKKDPKYSYAALLFVGLIFSFSTIANGIAMFMNQLAFVDDRNYPGGPAVFASEQVPITQNLNLVATACYFFNQWLQDGFLLYRLYVIADTLRTWMMPVPVLLYIGSIVLSCLLLAELSLPTWTALGNDTTITYYSFVVALNMLITLLIVVRLMSTRATVRKYLGPEHGSLYTSVSALLIESAVLYSAIDLAFIITFALNSNGAYILQPIVGQLEAIPPFIIVLRVAQGKGVTQQTMRSMQGTRAVTGTSMQFATAAVTTRNASMNTPMTAKESSLVVESTGMLTFAETK
ncbi:hypothetical protein PUNSTDRAFT_75406 [Punctularia strigosozonata HHB-11173 SS5]|uniref:Uncharacterized protein n=1 Tax=Punctularia strigosozonata (strain HHB-11173) TaxID=741275 RepID=R7S5T0_PUNST|nr:uncharacterized protein PUNSTDRAFT_75406 [Punctularia strigosozonata HHB-11173 SS5]EIN05001.1 hypothetical protein PUNSTDRAFT_75406 [Punctularia strigosozonata HHB-11173 SS5]